MDIHTHVCVQTQRQGTTYISGGQGSAVLFPKEQTRTLQCWGQRNNRRGGRRRGGRRDHSILEMALVTLWTSIHDLRLAVPSGPSRDTHSRRKVMASWPSTVERDHSFGRQEEDWVTEQWCPASLPAIWPAVSREIGGISQSRGVWRPR